MDQIKFKPTQFSGLNEEEFRQLVTEQVGIWGPSILLEKTLDPEELKGPITEVQRLDLEAFRREMFLRKNFGIT